MKILRLDRRQGKTTTLIKMAHKEKLYIVCATRQRAEYISKMAMEMDLNIPFPITVGEIRSTNGIKSRFIDKVLIDDMEDVLRVFIGKDVELATTSVPVVIA